jgi:hypothetical protein
MVLLTFTAALIWALRISLLMVFTHWAKSLFVFEVILCSIIEIEDVFFILLAELLSLLECHAEVPFTSAFAKVIKIGENAMISVQNP